MAQVMQMWLHSKGALGSLRHQDTAPGSSLWCPPPPGECHGAVGASRLLILWVNPGRLLPLRGLHFPAHPSLAAGATDAPWSLVGCGGLVPSSTQTL